MTQASLSPDLRTPIDASSASIDTSSRTGMSSEATLWLLGLTSTTLLVASLLLLGLLAQGTVSDASVGGFAAGVTAMIAAIGVGVIAYVLFTAKQAGYLSTPAIGSSVEAEEAPRGLRIVPAIPAGLGQRKRQKLEVERSARSKQALAIATATAPRRPPRPTAPLRVQPARTPRRTPVRMPAPVRMPVPAPTNVRPTVRPQALSTVRMPPRPRPMSRPMAATAPVHMYAPHPHARRQVATFQVGAANIRMPRMATSR